MNSGSLDSEAWSGVAQNHIRSHWVRCGRKLDLLPTIKVTSRSRVRTSDSFDGRRLTHLTTSGLVASPQQNVGWFYHRFTFGWNSSCRPVSSVAECTVLWLIRTCSVGLSFHLSFAMSLIKLQFSSFPMKLIVIQYRKPCIGNQAKGPIINTKFMVLIYGITFGIHCSQMVAS